MKNLASNTTPARDERTPGGGTSAGLTDAVWLAADELRRSRVSLAVTGFGDLLIGLVAGALIVGAYAGREEGALLANFPLEVIFVYLVPYLTLNWLGRPYWTPWRDHFTSELAFLRSMPISASGIARSWAVKMVATLFAAAPVFFLGAYFAWTMVDGSYLPPAATYLWFALIWVGYALFCGGGAIFTELGMSGKRMFYVQMTVLLALVVLAAVASGALLDGSLVLATLDLAATHGPLSAGVALLVGAGGFWLGVRATGRRLARRDLSL